MPESENDAQFTHPRERDVFLAAVEIPDEARRRAYLDESCGQDSHLRCRVDHLLSLDAAPDGVLAEDDRAVTPPLATTVRIDAVPKDREASSNDSSRRNPQDSKSSPQGSAFGRYLIERSLGRGGFGEVFLAEDTELHRQVALKVINRGALEDPERTLMEEGRTLAQLDHPGVVTVHDIGKEAGQIYVVSAYVKGKTLDQWTRDNSLSPAESAKLIAEIAEALAYVHGRAVVHRDVKPNNIIITPEGRPILIDFGIALVTDRTQKNRQAILGTPNYMSPEQARGEGHLVDGRSDIYSLGVILYEMLTGSRPFAGTSDLLENVASPVAEARALRETDPSIPRAIERICLKALAKRAADRYPSADRLADDLGAFVEGTKRRENGTTTISGGSWVIPRGLRPFDETDADFFLQLLPGLRDQAGVPDGIRFWQRGIENQVDPFRVGVLYGPSGSGKSSFLKAGLLPLLDKSIDVLFVPAESGQTERLLAEGLRDRFPGFDVENGLDACLHEIRTGGRTSRSGGKLLIVIDQFEQWLHTHGKDPDAELVSALRQCDGKSVQILLSLRDDFWMPISQLMEDIDVELLQSRNTAAIDLFDPGHARKVLIEFGRAYERLPRGSDELSQDQAAFVDAALADMEQSGKIIPLQLALFADMAKAVDWTKESYRRLGGATAIGVAFLDSVFTQSTANPTHRAVEKPARAILAALLPPGKAGIRGRPLGREELIHRSDLDRNPETFDAALRVLGGEVRLITPVGTEEESSEPRYQLTHDYLVPVIRDWLQRKQRETLRGRAELRLSDLAASYRYGGERRHLPSLLEWFRIRLLTRRKTWTADQRKMMGVAARRLLLQTGALAGFAILLIPAGKYLSNRQFERDLIDQLTTTPTADVAHILERIDPSSAAIRNRAEPLLEKAELETTSHTNLSLLLLPDRPDLLPSVEKRLLSASPEEFSVIASAIESAGYSVEPVASLEAVLQEGATPRATRIRALAALARFAPEDTRWTRDAKSIADIFLRLPVAEAAAWAPELRPVAAHLEAPLLEAFGNWGIESPARLSESPLAAAVLLAGLHRSNPDKLMRLVDRAHPEQIRLLRPSLVRVRKDLAALLESRARTTHLPDIEAESLEQAARIQAKSIALESSLGRNPGILVDSFRKLPHPVVREHLIRVVEPCGVPVESLGGCLQTGMSAEGLRAAILSIGQFPDSEISSDFRSSVESDLLKLYLHAEAPVHSAARWLLTRWGWDPEEFPRLESLNSGQSSWYATRNGHVMVEMKGVDSNSPAFWMAATETTVRQFSAFSGRQTAGDEDFPIRNITLFEVFEYCNWVSENEGIPKDQWCYRLDPDRGHLVPASDSTGRTGYRIPSPAEWRLSADSVPGLGEIRQRDMTLHFAGAWHLENSSQQVHKVAGKIPNRFGHFDIFGNCQEFGMIDSNPQTGSGILGGHYRFLLKEFSKLSWDGFPPDLSSLLTSFRLTRTIPEKNIAIGHAIP